MNINMMREVSGYSIGYEHLKNDIIDDVRLSESFE